MKLNWLKSAFGEWKHRVPLGHWFNYEMVTGVIFLDKELTRNWLSRIQGIN